LAATPYLRDDRFDQDGMLALLEEVLRIGGRSGNPLVRFVSRVETVPWWTRQSKRKPGWEYETSRKYAVSKYNDTVICTYDLTKLQCSLMMDMLRVTPL